MLQSILMSSLSFGIIYGMMLLKNNKNYDAQYLVGRWQFSSNKTLIYYFIALIIVTGIPTIITVVLLPRLISLPVLTYIIASLGVVYAGFSFVFFMS